MILPEEIHGIAVLKCTQARIEGFVVWAQPVLLTTGLTARLS